MPSLQALPFAEGCFEANDGLIEKFWLGNIGRKDSVCILEPVHGVGWVFQRA